MDAEQEVPDFLHRLVHSKNEHLLKMEMGARRVPRRRALVRSRSPEPAERFPPMRVTIPWCKELKIDTRDL